MAVHRPEFEPTPESIPSIDVRRFDHPKGVVLEITGDIDLSNATQLGAVFDHVLRAAPAVLVIDLSRVTFLGSTGIAQLIRARDHAGAGEVRLAAPSAVARRAIEILALDRVLPVFSTVDGALSTNTPRP
jgi:anti-anti-sigma factor